MLAGLLVSLFFFTGCSLRKPNAVAQHETSLEMQALEEQEWQWHAITHPAQEALIVDKPEQYTLRFIEGTRISIKADCNRALGNFKFDPKKQTLNIQIGPATQAFCPPPSRSDEFIALVQKADKLEKSEKGIWLTLKDGTRLDLLPLGAETLQTTEENPAP